VAAALLPTTAAMILAVPVSLVDGYDYMGVIVLLLPVLIPVRRPEPTLVDAVRNRLSVSL
jgi:hypothetical protein